MRKSAVVKLVLLNSLLAVSACNEPCEKKDNQDNDPNHQAANFPSCHGSRARHGGGWHYFGGGSGVSSGSRTGTTSSVSRGGFGASGHAAS